MTRRRYAWKRDPEKLLDKADDLWLWALRARTLRVMWQRMAKSHNAHHRYIKALLSQMEGDRK